jgi:hypothetical protein
MKSRGGSRIVENNKSRRGIEKSRERRSVEYLAINCKVIATFIIISEMCKRESV